MVEYEGRGIRGGEEENVRVRRPAAMRLHRGWGARGM